MVTWLPPAAGVFVDEELDGVHHPNRPALEALLADPDDPAPWRELRSDYDQQAPDWASWADAKAAYTVPLVDGLAHMSRAGTVLEVGAGSGSASLALEDYSPRVFSSDVSFEMIRRNPTSRRLCCDVRALPFATASLDAIVGLNAVPHVDEFARVLRPGGQVLWATTFGPRTPMYVSPEALERGFPGWAATARLAGSGEWCRLDKAAA